MAGRAALQSEGWADDVAALQSSCVGMKAQLVAARDRWEGLVALMGLAALAQVRPARCAAGFICSSAVLS